MLSSHICNPELHLAWRVSGSGLAGSGDLLHMREAGVEKMSEYIENNASQLSLPGGDGSPRYEKEKR